MKELLEALVEACPGRFYQQTEEGIDEHMDAVFLLETHGDEVVACDGSASREWLIEELNRLPIAAIYKLEGKSWEESILSEIVNWHQTNKEGK